MNADAERPARTAWRALVLDAPHAGDYLDPMSVATMQDELLGLPAMERVRLIDLLWDSLASPDLKAREAAWAVESERRIEAFETGKLRAREAQAVFADLRKDMRK
jgi:putative addiction module component (TIGR02574 family)